MGSHEEPIALLGVVWVVVMLALDSSHERPPRLRRVGEPGAIGIRGIPHCYLLLGGGRYLNALAIGDTAE